MEPLSYTLLVLAAIFGFYMAWNIGANDVANAMGTSVGSGALTLRNAVILAALLEFAGAFFAGASVSDTIRKGIVDPEVFAAEPTLFVCGMLASLLAAGVWLQIASYFGWPVSTTHSIIGAVIGFGAVFAGIQAINWDKAGLIAVSWVISPVLSGTISYFIFRIVLRRIFHQANPVLAAKRMVPALVFLLVSTLSLVLVFKGLKHKLEGVDLSTFDSILIAAAVGAVAAIVAWVLARRMKITDEESAGVDDHRSNAYASRALDRAHRALKRATMTSTGETREKAAALLEQTELLASSSRSRLQLGTDHPAFRRVERIFIPLQILSAAFIAFAHGSNDVANAIGPFVACWETIRTGAVEAESSVSPLFLAVGGLGIVVGLATWGWRVMRTIGRRITELTPSRGFCAEFGAGLTIVLASVMGIPISTTHTVVGAVLGVGLAGGIGSLNLATVRDVIVSWIVTIPAGAGLAIIFYFILKALFA